MTRPPRLSAFVIAVGLTCAACTSSGANPAGGPRTFDPVTQMAQVQAAGELRVGLPKDLAPFAYTGDGAPRGFMVDLARFIADSLGVKPVFVVGPSGKLVKMADRGQLDMTFSTSPITQLFTHDNPTTNPYFVAHQQLLVAAGSGLEQVSDLGDKRLCASLDPVTEVAAGELGVTPSRVIEASPARCIALLRKGKVDAVTASNVKLLPGAVDDPRLKITGDQLSTEGYGIVGAPEGKGWIAYLDREIVGFKAFGSWIESYDKWIADYVPRPLTQAPKMAVEDAAALFPEATPTPSPSPAG